MTEIQTRKKNLHETQIVETSIPEISEGEICLKVDRFAFTSNNFTYGVAGDMLGYWQFFPPKASQSQGWGILPVWGLADVIESKTSGIPIGERIFGYFPPATHLKMKPVKITDANFVDGVDHRSALPPGYNQYSRVAGESGYSPAMDYMRMLLFPLHVTSFCLHDYISSADWFGAEQVIIVSASSKTALGLAYALHSDDTAPKVVGLTSSRNLNFVKCIGYYDEAVPYDALGDIKNVPTAIVDLSGNTALIKTLRAQLGDDMKHCVNVGLTHWEEIDASALIEQDERTFQFFAPGHIQKRRSDWGTAEFRKRSMGFMMKSMQSSQSWLKVKNVSGINEFSNIYQDVSDGRIPANEGVIVTI